MQRDEGKDIANFRVIIIGSQFVGKSTFCEKLAIDCQWNLDLIYKLGYSLYKRDDILKDHMVQVEILNTLGYERYKKKLLEYIERCDGIILMYDITEEASFDEIKIWIDEVQEHHQRPLARLLLGNKNDLDDEREVSYEEGRQFGEKFKGKFLEVSAQKSDGIAHAYRVLLLEMILKKVKGDDVIERK